MNHIRICIMVRYYRNRWLKMELGKNISITETVADVAAVKVVKD